METRFIPITQSTEWEAVRQRSEEGPILLFKHDPFCSISLRAYRELAGLGGDVSLLDVAGSRSLSMDVASQTGVAHESPQVAALSAGGAAWSLSHGRITREAVKEGLASARQATPFTAGGS